MIFLLVFWLWIPLVPSEPDGSWDCEVNDVIISLKSQSVCCSCSSSDSERSRCPCLCVEFSHSHGCLASLGSSLWCHPLWTRGTTTGSGAIWLSFDADWAGPLRCLRSFPPPSSLWATWTLPAPCAPSAAGRQPVDGPHGTLWTLVPMSCFDPAPSVPLCPDRCPAALSPSLYRICCIVGILNCEKTQGEYSSGQHLSSNGIAGDEAHGWGHLRSHLLLVIL